MQRTSFWLALPLIALTGFALSFYSPRGAQAGSSQGSDAAVDRQPRPSADLVRVSDRPPTRPGQEQRVGEGRAPRANETR